MKNTPKVLGLIFITVLVFSNVSCTGGGGKSFNSAEALKAYLDKQPVNSPDKPIKVSMTINDAMFKNVARVIQYAGKYVSLNISGNALTYITDESFENCDTLVSINIPKSVTGIGPKAFWYCENLTSIKFEGAVNFYENSFSGDLFTKLQAGGIGTYTTEKPGSYAEWTKQLITTSGQNNGSISKELIGKWEYQKIIDQDGELTFPNDYFENAGIHYEKNGYTSYTNGSSSRGYQSAYSKGNKIYYPNGDIGEWNIKNGILTENVSKDIYGEQIYIAKKVQKFSWE